MSGKPYTHKSIFRWKKINELRLRRPANIQSRSSRFEGQKDKGKTKFQKNMLCSKCLSKEEVQLNGVNFWMRDLQKAMRKARMYGGEITDKGLI